MYTLESFYKEVFNLSKSLVIKSTDLTLYVESKLENIEYDIPLEERRYVKHVCGERHREDTDVYINVIELEEKMLLTKDLMLQYPATHTELLKNGDFYNNLIEAYPDMITYIHGCMYHVSKEDYLNASEYDILSYNSRYVEEQEYNLIPELQNYIKTIYHRYYNRYYGAGEEYYIPSFIGVMYSKLPTKIINIRLGNIKTNKAHTFFLESYFNSNFNLWESVKELNKETIWWLYRNLDYIIKHIGKNDTFELILDKIFAANNVGIGGYSIKYQDPSLVNENIYEYDKLPYSTTKTIPVLDPLNNAFIESGNIKTINNILTNELEESEYEEERKEFLIDKYNKEIDNNTIGKVSSKVLEISTLETFDSFNRDLYQLLLDHWGYLLSNDLYGSFTNDNLNNSKIEIQDPNTNMYYKVGSKTGFLILIKLLLSAMGKGDMEIKYFYYGKVYDPKLAVEKTLTTNLYQDGYTARLHTFLKDNYPVITNAISSVTEAKTYLEKVLNFSKNVWLLDANSENAFVSANLKTFLFFASKQSKYAIHNSLNYKTIDSLLAENGIAFKITNDYDYVSMIKELYEKCLGITINDNSSLRDILLVYKDILNKLTSYTLQTIGNINSQDSTYVHYNHVNALQTENPLIKFLEGTLEGQPLDNTYYMSNFIPYDTNEEIKTIPMFQNPIIHEHMENNHFKPTLQYNSSELYGTMYPQNTYYLLDLPAKGIEHCNVKNNYLTIFGLVMDDTDHTNHLLTTLEADENIAGVEFSNDSPNTSIKDLVHNPETDKLEPVILKQVIGENIAIGNNTIIDLNNETNLNRDSFILEDI